MPGSPGREQRRFIPELSKSQREAADFRDGVCVVAAVPGSGKTLTMAGRIGILVRERGVSPEHILGLAFTRSAARAMRSHLDSVLGSRARLVTLATVHSFCYMLLTRETGRFELIREARQLALIREILRDHPFRDLQPGAILREISLARNNMLTPGEFRVLHEHDPDFHRIALIMETYRRRKQDRGWLDFDDLLLETIRLLRDRPELGRRRRERYRHILVDEFQDTSPAQAAVIRLLYDGAPGSSLWVCGDDWQSIYSFNGASVGNLLEFRNIFPGAAIFTLPENYRSTPQILDACRNLIRHNRRSMEKPLLPVCPPGPPVLVIESESEEDEAAVIASEILTRRAEGRAWGDMAVLYRSNYQSRVIEECFERFGIPYRTERGADFYRRPEVSTLIDLLRYIEDRDSEEGDRALRRVLESPRIGVGKRFSRIVAQSDFEGEVPFRRGIRESEIPDHRVRRRVEMLSGTLDFLAAESQLIPPAELIGKLRAALNYDRSFTGDEVPGPDDARVQNINQLQLAAVKYTSLRDFLAFTGRMERATGPDRNQGVRLMTVHRSKGLEFPVVFVAGMVEGVLPARKGDLEEERRVCFVAISRAGSELILSVSRTHLGRLTTPSLFVDEIAGRNSRKHDCNFAT